MCTAFCKDGGNVGHQTRDQSNSPVWTNIKVELMRGELYSNKALNLWWDNQLFYSIMILTCHSGIMVTLFNYDKVIAVFVKLGFWHQACALCAKEIKRYKRFILLIAFSTKWYNLLMQYLCTAFLHIYQAHHQCIDLFCT